MKLFQGVGAELLIKTLYSAAALRILYFAGIEGMALRTDFDFKRIDVLGRTDLELSAASAGHVYDFVSGLDIFLHNYTSFVYGLP